MEKWMADTFHLVPKAIDLMRYTYTVTSNTKRYPRKYIMLVQEIQKTCMSIYKLLMYANRLSLKDEAEKNQRVSLQTKTICTCDELSCFVQLSMELNLIGANTVEYWQKKISDIKYMTIAWRSRDKKS